jgi:ligand-binding sensor domain-containing protein
MHNTWGKSVMLVKKILLLLVIIYFFYTPAYSQSTDIKFEHITVEQGLSNNKIRCTIQDKYGFIWIGTYEGLNRFDGYEFKIFRNDPEDSTSLSSNWITDLFEDSAGDLWISTMGGGLNKFDREKERFIRVSHNVYNRLMWQGKGSITMKKIAENQN